MVNDRVKKFLSYYKPYTGLFLMLMFCAFVYAGITLAFPLLIRYITKVILEQNLGNALNQIYQVGALMLALIAIQVVAGYFIDYRGHAMGAMMEGDLRSELFEHFQKLSFRFYDEQKTGQLMSRITNDLFSLAELYHHGPEDVMIYTVKFIGAFAILAQINLRLTLAVFLFLPFMAVYAIYFNKKMHAALKRNKERIGDINAQVEDTLAGIRVVKSFANESVERRKFARENQRFLESRKNGYRNEAYFSQGIEAFTQLILVAIVVLGGISIAHASLDLADLITFLLYISNLIEPIQKFLHVAMQYQEGVTGFERFMEVLEVEPEMKANAHPIELKNVEGNLEFRNVSFRYNQNHVDLLKNVSIQVKAGESIALVGTSGVGKTTFCSLIPRFYDVCEGEILLDGIDIRRMSLRSLRRNVGVVQQDVYLFASTVLENIRYGKPQATFEEAVKAAKKANAHEFIMALPDGYETDIGQRGVKLSGGQRQRLSIARVFLKDPPVLILDEATSALDNESERIVQDSLQNLAKNRTTFIIAHRLTTIRNAKRIVVLNQQRIEEQGTHSELIDRGGTYARLYALQFADTLNQMEV